MQEEEEVVDLSELRAGGNTSTFDADAHCPTCRTPVPYRQGERAFPERNYFGLFFTARFSGRWDGYIHLKEGIFSESRPSMITLYRARGG